MVGWLDMWEGQSADGVRAVRLLGLPVLRTALPADARPWRVRRALKALARRGVRRVLLPPHFPYMALLAPLGLTPVSSLGLCRALAPRLAYALLAPVPPRQRSLLLRGYGDSAALLPPLAAALCPLTANLMADTDRGFHTLAAGLRKQFGAALLTPDQGPEPLVTLELSPGPEGAGKRLKLWGEPCLAGLTLTAEGLSPPPGADPLPLLTLLWETGRLEIEQILVS